MSDEDGVIEEPFLPDKGLSMAIFAALNEYIVANGPVQATDLPDVCASVSYYVRTYLGGHGFLMAVLGRAKQRFKKRGREIFNLQLALREKDNQIRWLVARVHELEGMNVELQAVRIVRAENKKPTTSS